MTTTDQPHGIFAPTLTPMHSDLSPDTGRWIEHCRRLLQAGCHGLCPFGTTSEANSFSVDERIDMLEELVDADVPAHQLIPGTGCCALTDTVRLTAHSVNLGCAGVLMLPPFYYKGMSDDGLFRSYAEVIERVGHPKLRIYLYHIPPVSQVGISLDLIERLVTTYPDTVVGIKDSSRDWNNLHALLTNFPGFNVFTGSARHSSCRPCAKVGPVASTQWPISRPVRSASSTRIGNRPMPPPCKKKSTSFANPWKAYRPFRPSNRLWPRSTVTHRG